ncbi:hypothetical protein OZ410_07145 [Robiginitalea sp. M366]|uniref:hypothetical protein n=1 Tax=Robiginitalea aestuariiviva TaxID=3036903 RepID=UPI00240D88F6|nr:hypothetical protein [Robiginitalea aestuariiviva]MDG1572086.1 hypothetical protein [Robiginitalea aestuariiviva]
MRQSFLFFTFALLLHTGLQAQLNAYKYVVVPLQFEAFNQMNLHQTSTTVKYYLEQYGLPVIYDNAKPREIVENPCHAAYVKLQDNSGLFATRVILSIVDCEGKVLMTSSEGRSKEKDFKESFRQAIEQASLDFANVNYRYTPPAEPAVTAVETQAEAPEPQAPPMPEVIAEVAREPEPAAETEAEALAQPEAPAEADLWYAQKTADGYQLVDRTPQIRMQLVATAQEDTYMALVDGNPMGIVYKADGQWVHQYYQDGSAQKKVLHLKF